MITSFEPIIGKSCKILILGTMPSVKSLKKLPSTSPANEIRFKDKLEQWKVILSYL